ncbi:MAG: TonB-dependent receptor plug domain-containing protein, partial [Betaproteobacteria bacterium]
EIERMGDATVGEILKRLPGVTVGGRPGRGGDPRMRGLGGGSVDVDVGVGVAVGVGVGADAGSTAGAGAACARARPAAHSTATAPAPRMPKVKAFGACKALRNARRA